MKKNCPCGAPLLPHPGKGRPRLYCSSLCGARARYGYTPTVTVTGTCDQCGKDWARKGRAGKGRFCSKHCSNIWHGRHPSLFIKTCAECNREYVGLAKSIVCSKDCRQTRAIKARNALYPPGPNLAKNHAARAKRFNVEYDYKVNRLGVLERDGWICQLCNEEISHTAIYPSAGYGSIDHVLPMSRGGGHVWNNVQAAHLGCNIAKGAGNAEPPEAARATRS